LLTADDAGYLPLLCAADSLAEGGRFETLLSESQDFAANLGVRLRSRVYERAVPRIAQALINRHEDSGGKTDDESLARLYNRALLILFRLLFVAYAEDRELLPLRTNGLYRQRSLKNTARQLADQANTHGWDSVPFDENATDLWDNARTLWRAVDKGRTEWNVPPYNGGMFSTDPVVNADGAAVASISLRNAEFGPALLGLLVDESDGEWGPVDFASLDVREFGTIYEGLLESDLAVAPFDLAVDENDKWVPASLQDEVVVSQGGVYLHDRSGARKASGSYFTKPFAVNHLLDHALEPALDIHIERITQLAAVGDDAGAAQAFFDFRCIDLAMGSGHFLVAAVDRIERRLSRFLSEHRVPGVLEELARLADAAQGNLEKAGVVSDGIDTNALLRRQIARRCVYGVDLNATAVELARLALWIHTFVKGLPLTSLNRGLVVGNSLTGLSNLSDVLTILDGDARRGTVSLFSEAFESALTEAVEAVERFSVTSEANTAEVRSAREAHDAATRAMMPVRRLLDYALAVRLGLEPRPVAITSADMYRKAAEFDSDQLKDLQAIHFPVVFPEVLTGAREGFDCILGNPPYDKVRHEPQQFWVKRSPGLHSLSAKQQVARIEDLRRLMPTDAAIELREMAVRERMQQMAAVSFTLQGAGQHGHHDLAKMFVERALALLSPDGCLGYVLPRTALVIGGWTDIRKAIVAAGSVEIIQARNKAGWLFEDVDNRLMFALLTLRRGVLPAALTIWPDVASPEQIRTISAENSIHMSVEEVEALTDKWVIPWFSSPTDVITFDKLRACTGRLGTPGGWISGRADSSRWDFSGSGPHKGYLGRNTEKAWQVLMTRHVDAYRIAVEDTFQRHIPSPLKLIPLGRGVEKRSGDAALSTAHPTIVYRYPSRNDDSRTLIATALPDQGYLFSKGYVSGVVTADSTERDVMALLALMNSWTCDWWVRRFVDRHVTKQIIENIPLPNWDESAREHVAGLASYLLEDIDMLPGGRPVPTKVACNSKTDALVEIEMTVLDGYGLDGSDLTTILYNFSDKGCPPAIRRRLVEKAEQR
jgi:methylase of polypeptide subunit release factors